MTVAHAEVGLHNPRAASAKMSMKQKQLIVAVRELWWARSEARQFDYLSTTEVHRFVTASFGSAVRKNVTWKRLCTLRDRGLVGSCGCKNYEQQWHITPTGDGLAEELAPGLLPQG